MSAFHPEIMCKPGCLEWPRFASALVLQKSGTTSLADHLKRHPAIGCIDGLPWHPVLRKESHYFNGVLGKAHAHSAFLYRSFFPTILAKWWAERIVGVQKVRLQPDTSKMWRPAMLHLQVPPHVSDLDDCTLIQL